MNFCTEGDLKKPALVWVYEQRSYEQQMLEITTRIFRKGPDAEPFVDAVFVIDANR